MHASLRSTFVELYSQYDINTFLDYNNIDKEEYKVPEQGNLNLDEVLNARYMFG